MSDLHCRPEDEGSNVHLPPMTANDVTEHTISYRELHYNG